MALICQLVQFDHELIVKQKYETRIFLVVYKFVERANNEFIDCFCLSGSHRVDQHVADDFPSSRGTARHEYESIRIHNHDKLYCLTR